MHPQLWAKKKMNTEKSKSFSCIKMVTWNLLDMANIRFSISFLAGWRRENVTAVHSNLFDCFKCKAPF